MDKIGAYTLLQSIDCVSLSSRGTESLLSATIPTPIRSRIGINIAASMTCILLNYLAWLLDAGDTARNTAILLTVFSSVALIVRCLKIGDLFFLPVFTLGLAIVLYHPLLDWDARAIWFFHAKRMFYDASLYAILDNYAALGHNDYPDLVPCLAASITRLANVWNEVLPKLSIFIVLLPPVTLLLMLFTGMWRCMVLVVMLVSLRQYLLNGYMDGILAVYIATLLLYSCRLLWPYREGAYGGGRMDRFLILLMIACIACLKNEGLIFALQYSALYGVFLLRQKKPLGWRLYEALAIIAAFIPIAIWKIHLIGTPVGNDLLDASAPLRLRWLERFNLHDMHVILIYTCEMGIFLIALLAYASTWVFPSMKKQKVFVLVLLSGYYCALFLVYMIAPRDLVWHLQNSAERTVMPIILTLFLFYLWFWQEYLFRRAILTSADAPPDKRGSTVEKVDFSATEAKPDARQ